jgi:hypothetical protein
MLLMILHMGTGGDLVGARDHDGALGHSRG